MSCSNLRLHLCWLLRLARPAAELPVAAVSLGLARRAHPTAEATKRDSGGIFRCIALEANLPAVRQGFVDVVVVGHRLGGESALREARVSLERETVRAIVQPGRCGEVRSSEAAGRLLANADSFAELAAGASLALRALLEKIKLHAGHFDDLRILAPDELDRGFVRLALENQRSGASVGLDAFAIREAAVRAFGRKVRAVEEEAGELVAE